MTRHYKTAMEPTQYLDCIDCDGCGKPVAGEGAEAVSRVASLSASWGYGTPFDMETHECDLCVTCYTAVREFIEKTLGGTVKTNALPPDPLDDDELAELFEEEGEAPKRRRRRY